MKTPFKTSSGRIAYWSIVKVKNTFLCFITHITGNAFFFTRSCFICLKSHPYVQPSNSGKNFLTTSGEKILNVSQLLSREEEIQTPDFPLLYRLLQSFCSCFHVCFWRNEQLVPLWLISILQEIMFQLMPAQATLAIRQF